MYATTSSSGRDLQAMSDEVRHLTERRADLEEQELAVMLEQDPIDAELQALRARMVPVEQQVDERRCQVAEGQREIDAELATADRLARGSGGPPPDCARRSLRDATRPPEGDRRRPPHQEPVRRVPSRALLRRGREDPRAGAR